MTSRTTRAILVIVTLIVLALAGASAVFAKQGDENLQNPLCASDGGEFILSPSNDVIEFEGLTFLKQSGKAIHYTSGPLTQESFDAIVAQNENLKLSHCLGEEATATPVPSETEQPSETPVVTPSEKPVVTPKPEVPNTAMAAEQNDPDSTPSMLALIGGALLVAGVMLYARKERD